MVKNINAAGQYGDSQFTVSNTSSDAAYNNIQDAVTAASSVSGASVKIQPGTYNESIAWPPNITVEGSTTVQEDFDVVINGNQTFAGNGDLSFETIQFSAAAGDIFTHTTSSGISIVDFTRCKLIPAVGKGYVISGAGLFALGNLFHTQIEASGNCIEAFGDSGINLNQCTLLTITANINAIEMDDSASLEISRSSVSLTASGTGVCVALNSASNVAISSETKYSAIGTASSSAFLFGAAAEVESLRDTMNINTGTYWARSTGAFGLIRYALNIITDGTTELIDPQITPLLLKSLYSEALPVKWSVKSSGTVLLPFEGFISNGGGAEVFPLPASASVGDVFELTESSTGSVSISQAAGQSIRFGNSITTVGVGGSITSTASGDAIKLVCVVADTGFQAVTGAIGNWTVI